MKILITKQRRTKNSFDFLTFGFLVNELFFESQVLHIKLYQPQLLSKLYTKKKSNQCTETELFLKILRCIYFNVLGFLAN